METDLILCDTDIIMEYFNMNILLLEYLKEIWIEKLIISSVTRAEVQQGAQDIAHLSKINKVLDKFPTLDLYDSTIRLFFKLFEQFILSHQCTSPDMLNASLAITYDLRFFT